MYISIINPFPAKIEGERWVYNPWFPNMLLANPFPSVCYSFTGQFPTFQELFAEAVEGPGTQCTGGTCWVRQILGSNKM